MWSLSAHSEFPLFNISWVFGEKTSPGERGTLGPLGCPPGKEAVPAD